MISFNVSDGAHRSGAKALLPKDYATGWMHLIAAVDREANEVRYSFDFGPMQTVKLRDELKGVSFSTSMPTNIGQDGTGTYGAKLPAALDEFLLLHGALTDEDAAKLKSFYLG